MRMQFNIFSALNWPDDRWVLRRFLIYHADGESRTPERGGTAVTHAQEHDVHGCPGLFPPSFHIHSFVSFKKFLCVRVGWFFTYCFAESGAGGVAPRVRGGGCSCQPRARRADCGAAEGHRQSAASLLFCGLQGLHSYATVLYLIINYLAYYCWMLSGHSQIVVTTRLQETCHWVRLQAISPESLFFAFRVHDASSRSNHS